MSRFFAKADENIFSAHGHRQIRAAKSAIYRADEPYRASEDNVKKQSDFFPNRAELKPLYFIENPQI